MQQNIFNLETEFDIMFKKVVLGFGQLFTPEKIRLGRRVGESFQDVSIHLAYKDKEIEETRAVICIEVKKPDTSGLREIIENGRTTKKLEESVHQALGYAYANYYIRNQIGLRPVCILTDGEYIAFLDADESFKKNFRTLTKFPSSKVFKFSIDLIKKHFANIKNAKIEDLRQKEKSLFSPYVVESSTRAEETCDSRLAADLLKTFNLFKMSRISPEISIDYTMQCFLLLVLRNCGFISATEMDIKIADENNHLWMKDLLARYFSNNFTKVSTSNSALFVKAYNATKMYDVRVDAMPQEELGYAYEAFIRKAKKMNTTEFYTPDNLIKEVLDEVKPTVGDIIFDPTCGCGSFLIAAVRRIFYRQINSINDLKQLSKFLTNNVFGNDRDFYASCIAKAGLLSLFVERLGIDPTMLKLKFPTIKQNFFTEDYFDFKWKLQRKPTLIIGNAPWGDVSSDSKSFKDLVGTKERWDKIQKVRNLKDDRHEISGSIVLKCLEDFGGSSKFRMGLLIKQQILVKGKDQFMADDRTKRCYFFDYGPRQLFKHTASLTAIAFYGSSKNKGVISKFPVVRENYGSMVKLSDLGCSFRKGPDTGNNDVWVALADKKGLDYLVVDCLKRDGHCQPLTRPSTYELVYLAPPNKKNSLDPEYAKSHTLVSKNLSDSQRNELLDVTTGAKTKSGRKQQKSGRKFPFTWRRPINDELLQKGIWKIILPFQWTGVEVGKSRLPLNCTKNSVVIRDSHICITFPPNTPEVFVVNTAAWLASTVFSESLEYLCSKQILKRLSGGYELNPTYCGDLFIPFKALTSTKLFKTIKDDIGKATFHDHLLKRIDTIVIETLDGFRTTNLLQKDKALVLLEKAIGLLEKAKQKQSRKSS